MVVVVECGGVLSKTHPVRHNRPNGRSSGEKKRGNRATTFSGAAQRSMVKSMSACRAKNGRGVKWRCARIGAFIVPAQCHRVPFRIRLQSRDRGRHTFRDQLIAAAHGHQQAHVRRVALDLLAQPIDVRL